MKITNKKYIQRIINECVERGRDLDRDLDKAYNSLLETECERLGQDELDSMQEDIIGSQCDLLYEKERDKWLKYVSTKLKTIGYTWEKVFKDNNYFIEAYLDDLYGFLNKFEKNTLEPKEQLKLNSEEGDLEFGNGFWVTKEGHIYNKNNNGKIITKVQGSGAYLLQTLVKGGKSKSLGRKDFKNGAQFTWGTIKKNKREIVKKCGEVITTNAKKEYYYSYQD